MFTQCPECSLSFRVTADVLKQAAGKVRCGGCRNTFNALDYLSEDKPGKERRRAVTGAPPELEAEPGDEPYNEPPPAAVSPEQSRKLLETLERLAESDVRIEDTGVEWRILSMEDDPDSELPDDDDEDVASAARGDDPESLPLAEELRFDDNTGLPDDFDLDAPVASRPRQPEAEPVAEKSHIDTHVDIAFGDPEEWSALLGEVVDDESPADADEAATAGETDERADGQPESVPELAQDGGPGDSLERELAEMNELLERVEPDSTGGIEVELEETHRDLEDSSIDEDLFAAAFESERRAKQRRGDTDMADDEIELHLDADLPTDQEDGSSAPEFREYDESLALDLESLSGDDALSLDFDALAANEDDDSGAGTDAADSGESGEFELFEELEEPVEFIASEEPEQIVPEPTEEEETINRMIDQELLAVAYEDEDGMASTIILDQEMARKAIEAPDVVAVDVAEDDADGDDVEDDAGEAGLPDAPTGVGVETIVMEGESVRDALEEQALEEARQRGEEPEPDAELAALKKKLKAEAEAEARARPDFFDDRRMVGGLVLLCALLVLQGIHFSRAALATVPGIGGAIEPVYRALGMPITPAWDVTGWRFEVTKGSTDPTRFTREIGADAAADDDGGPEVLTIYSRIGNRSDQPLPYPLISVSLTDRFEETIGNKVLEPAEYLPRGIDPAAPVGPGNTFDAVISIESPAADAAGFRLNVCYPLASGRLRCAIEHFK